jgi:hypothetical protein
MSGGSTSISRPGRIATFSMNDFSPSFGALAMLLLAGACWLAAGFFRRRRALRLFAKFPADERLRANVVHCLDDLSEQSPTLKFEMYETAMIPIRGQSVTLFWGPMAVSYGGVSWSHLFALADDGQAAWMQSHPDLFQPVFTGSPFSVFKVVRTVLENELAAKSVEPTRREEG